MDSAASSSGAPYEPCRPRAGAEQVRRSIRRRACRSVGAMTTVAGPQCRGTVRSQVRAFGRVLGRPVLRQVLPAMAGLRDRRRHESGRRGLARDQHRAAGPVRGVDRAGGGGLRAAGHARRGRARPLGTPAARHRPGHRRRHGALRRARDHRGPGHRGRADPRDLRRPAGRIVAPARLGQRRRVHAHRRAGTGRGPGDRQRAAVHVQPGLLRGRPRPGRRPDRLGRPGLGHRRGRGQLRGARRDLPPGVQVSCPTVGPTVTTSRASGPGTSQRRAEPSSSDRRLTGLLAVTCVFFFLYGPVEVALPIHIAQEIARLGRACSGLFWATFGIGAIARRARRRACSDTSPCGPSWRPSSSAGEPRCCRSA